jgi:FkbM family methyltransferase
MLPHLIRFTTRNVSRKWGHRLARRLPRRLLSTNAQVDYRGVRLNICTSDNIGKRIFFEGEYETQMEDALLGALPKGGLLFDVGANMGVFSLMAATKLGARVVAVEPSRQVLDSLRRHVALNGVEDRVTIVAAAVTDKEGGVTFYEGRADNCGIGRVFDLDRRTDDAESYPVATTTLPSLFRRYGRPDVIKMDIEGAEWLALHGAAESLRADADAPSILIEFHPAEIKALGGDVRECVAMIDSWGYEPTLRGVVSEVGHSWQLYVKSGSSKRDAIHAG